MIDEPMDFREALDHERVKRLLPTTLKSEDLMKLEAGIRERARFSAQVVNARFLQEVDQVVGKILRPTLDANGVVVGMDEAAARVALKDMIDRMDYQPPEGKEDTLEDLGSDQRLNLIIDTNVKMARSYGQWKVGQTKSVLDEWPFQELIRAEERKEPRDWPERWEALGGKFYPGKGPYEGYGRMIAAKNDPIWAELSEFGLPYFPLAFGSGMDGRDVSRDEGEELGVELPEGALDPQDRDFGSDIQSSLETMEPELQDATVESLREAGLEVIFRDGILMLKDLLLGNERANEASGTIFLIRHGSTELTDDGRISGWLDVPLTEDGRRQAAEAGCELADYGLGTIYTSGLKRARETADIVAGLTDAPEVVEDFGLLPWHLGPTIEGRPAESMAETVKHLVLNPDERPYGGETFNEFKARVIDGWKSIDGYDRAENAAVVTHHRVIQLLTAWKAAGGQGYDVDAETFLGHGDDPGSVVVVLGETGDISTPTGDPLNPPGAIQASSEGVIANASNFIAGTFSRPLRGYAAGRGMANEFHGSTTWSCGHVTKCRCGGKGERSKEEYCPKCAMANEGQPRQTINLFERAVSKDPAISGRVLAKLRDAREIQSAARSGATSLVGKGQGLNPAAPENALGNEGGTPCGHGFISADKACHIGQGLPPGTPVRKNPLLPAVRDQATKTWKTAEGADVPEHVKHLAIPPKWQEVQFNPDPAGDLQAMGKDAKGRVQRIYSSAFTAEQAKAKFERVNELMAKKEAVFAQNESNLGHADHDVRENAAVMKLVQTMGIRPGSDTDTKAKVQAYGATTLQGRHVVVGQDGKVRLQFTGKKGVTLDLPVEDEATAKMLRARKDVAGDTGKLFDTDDAGLRNYSHTLDGGGFKPKDFRTLKGTETAKAELAKQPERAGTMKEYEKRVMGIAKRVAEKLGNTPVVALKSYISPEVFETIKPLGI